MTDADLAAQFRALLIRLITDGAHHAQCAGLSRAEESRLTHDGFAAGFHIAALYAADVLATGRTRPAVGTASATRTRPPPSTSPTTSPTTPPHGHGPSATSSASTPREAVVPENEVRVTFTADAAHADPDTDFGPEEQS